MGAWERGINAANALHIGTLQGENNALRGENNALRGKNNLLNEEADILAKTAVNYRNQALPYRKFLKGKADNDSSVDVNIEILGSVRPDLIPKDASLGAKRVVNLKLFAWTEWFQQTLHGQSRLAENKAPILRSLSDVIRKTGTIENPELAVSALNDIAARMEFTVPMESGGEWVEARIQEMVANGVQFDPVNPTIPLAASIKQVVPNLIDYEKRTGIKYDPFTENMCGISSMAVR